MPPPSPLAGIFGFLFYVGSFAAIVTYAVYNFMINKPRAAPPAPPSSDKADFLHERVPSKTSAKRASSPKARGCFCFSFPRSSIEITELLYPMYHQNMAQTIRRSESNTSVVMKEMV